MMLRLQANELSANPEFKDLLDGTTIGNIAKLFQCERKTTLAQRLPADMEDKVVKFHRFVLRAR